MSRKLSLLMALKTLGWVAWINYQYPGLNSVTTSALGVWTGHAQGLVLGGETTPKSTFLILLFQFSI